MCWIESYYTLVIVFFKCILFIPHKVFGLHFTKNGQATTCIIESMFALMCVNMLNIAYLEKSPNKYWQNAKYIQMTIAGDDTSKKYCNLEVR